MTLDFLYHLVLVSWSEEVENDFHRVECCKRNFNEESVPVAHSSVPQTWKLKCLEFTALVALRADEACILVYILEKVEALAIVVMQTAYDVNRIEVSCRSKSLTSMFVSHVDLNALKNLK